MKMKITSGLFLFFLSTAFTALAAPKADFSGKWILDEEKSQGLPKGMTQVMTVTQNGEELNVTTKVYPAADMIASLVTDIYDLTGKETQYVAQRMGIPGQGRRTAKWAADRKGFDVSEEAVVEIPKQGAVKTEISRRWTLSDDGKMITIDIVSKDPQGETKSKRVFVKK